MLDISLNSLKQVAAIARDAGKVVMSYYDGDPGVKIKADGSPVTIADPASEKLIVSRLTGLTPTVPVVSEEAAANGEAPEPAPEFWEVDPLDGTKEYVKHNGEFTVNIALIENGEPVLGVIYAPAKDILYAGAKGVGAFVVQNGVWTPIKCRNAPAEGLTVVLSRSHGNDEAHRQFLTGRKIAERKQIGSSLKLCLIASGDADLYPRFGDTMEWDIAAGDAIIRVAGGSVNTIDGKPMRYGKPGYLNPAFVAHGLG